MSTTTAISLMDINKIIDIVHYLKEEGASTVSLGAGQIAGTKEAGDDPPVFKKKNRYATGGRDSRKWWLQFLKGK